jgi:hypothetical protein
MKKYYELVLTQEELAELSCAYAVAYTISREEDKLADFAIVNFASGNKAVQELLAEKIQILLNLGKDNAEKTV